MTHNNPNRSSFILSQKVRNVNINKNVIATGGFLPFDSGPTFGPSCGLLEDFCHPPPGPFVLKKKKSPARPY
jgi:hypothetical protein